MMGTKNEIWMRDKIIGFMIIIDDCLNSTTYSDDRPIYMGDLVAAAKWLMSLYKGEPIIQIYSEILSHKTNKHFGDYWRQGPWGEKEASALALLQEQIRNKFCLNK
jgi:hypothetical protein